MKELCNCEHPVKGLFICWNCGRPEAQPEQKENKGGYIALRSTNDGTEVRAYTVNSKRTAEKLKEDFNRMGFNCKIIDVDDECMRA